MVNTYFKLSVSQWAALGAMEGLSFILMILRKTSIIKEQTRILKD